MRRFLIFLVLVMLTGCNALPFPQSEGGISIGGNTPTAAAESFLKAWGTGSTDEMYSQISARSQGIYTPEAFNRSYQGLIEDIGLNGVEYTINDVHMQGVSAAIDYDLTLQSALFGEIQDTGRTMRMVKEGEQWRVAWSTMDIFEGYTAEANISVDSDPQPRENIYDRNGNPLVLENGTISVLYARQQAMSDVFACQRLLADLLYTPITDIQQEFQNYLPDARVYVGEVDEYIELEYAARLRDLCGMSRDSGDIYTRQARQYIGQGAAVHVTGYIGPVPEEDRARWINLGYSETDYVGLTGIEFAFQAQLAGRPPRVLRLYEPGGTLLRELGRTAGTPPQPVYLTIDRNLQIEAARALAWGYNYAINNWGRPDISPGAGAVVMDVNTGAILAMASYPTFQPTLFDPESYAPNRGPRLAAVQSNPRAPMLNRVTQERYSPGSVFKIVTTAAAINEGLTAPGELFECGLTWDGTGYGDTFSPRLDWRFTDGLDAAGIINPAQALTSSCDPWYYEFGARLFLESGADTVTEYAHMMGYEGQPGTGIYPEASSYIPVPDTVEEAINNGIGQGDTQVTVLQTAMMVASVANGGTVYEPYIVEQIGQQRVGQPTVLNTLDIVPEALEVARRGMCDVTTDYDLGTAIGSFVDNEMPPPYTACGKTGTAQTNTYPNAWFVAYAPADNPEIAVVVMAERSREGSEVAAPMVRRILDAYFGAPQAPFPEWWEGEYVPLQVPENGVAGG